MTWTVGLVLLFIGYAMFYTGLQNLRTSGDGPSLTESFGFPGPMTTQSTAERKGRKVPKP